MKKIASILGLLFVGCTSLMAQGAKNIKINEVVTHNTTSIQDEFGKHDPWVELVNVAYSSYNVRGMYITTDKSVLNPKMSAAERMKRMTIIPNNESRTALSARQHVVFYLNSNPAEGGLHLAVKADSTTQWIALYDGNAIDLIDSVSIPALKVNCSYARVKDGSDEWAIKTPNTVTPNIKNNTTATESKVDMLKRDDPHGFGITVLSMGIVFACLAVLYVFFSLLGWALRDKSKIKKVATSTPLKPVVKPVVKTGEALIEVGQKTNIILQDGFKSKGISKETYIAVIAMALKQYADDVHDVESGIITIKPRHTSWSALGAGTPVPDKKTHPQPLP
jgi:Na+-transporting methylmalonyl-CoA/oxaloacetate decarboxylase gamma subunit